MILDNILRSLNQYMKDMFTTFGGESKEYMTALKDVKENLPEEVLQQTARKGLDFEGDAPTEPLQLSRGKEAKNVLENFESDLQVIRKDQKEQGTARKQTEKYREDAENRGIDPETIDIQEEAKKLYDFDHSTNDWYEAIMADPDITDDEKEEIRDLYSDLFENYEDAAFRDRLEEAARDILRAADERRSDHDQYIPPVDDIGYDPSDDFGGRL
ncbi:MAG: hypothetical protein J5723_02560 [Ruminococcus sp.]|nr:hypothetical protein [Ruminococcus sp.]